MEPKLAVLLILVSLFECSNAARGLGKQSLEIDQLVVQLYRLAEKTISRFYSLQEWIGDITDEELIQSLTENKLIQTLLAKLLNVWTKINLAIQRTEEPLKALQDEAESLLESIRKLNFLDLVRGSKFVEMLRKKVEFLKDKHRNLLESPGWVLMQHSINYDISFIKQEELKYDLIKALPMTNASYMIGGPAEQMDRYKLPPVISWAWNLIDAILEVIDVPLQNMKLIASKEVIEMYRKSEDLSRQIQLLSNLVMKKSQY